MMTIGATHWAIAEGYIPEESVSDAAALVSHGTACILNACDRYAEPTITLYFADRPPAGPYRVTVASRSNAASAFQRPSRSRAGPPWHRLFLGDRLQRAGRRTAQGSISCNLNIALLSTMAFSNGAENIFALQHPPFPGKPGTGSGFEDRVGAVTGASAGVGRAIAKAFAQAGARLALIARDAESLDRVKQEIDLPDARILLLPLDVAEAEALAGAAGRIEAQLGPIDIWINDAMLTCFRPCRR